MVARDASRGPCARSIVVAIGFGLPAALAYDDEPELVLVGRVARVIDGDAIDVSLDSGQIRVRFNRGNNYLVPKTSCRGMSHAALPPRLERPS